MLIPILIICAIPLSSAAQFDYKQPLGLSFLFYEAQRAGYLPSSNRIPWRKDAATNDGRAQNLDLSGGWFDAGDTMKFNFPMAASASTLAWSGVEYKAAYQVAGLYDILKDNVKWALDYLLKCDSSPGVLYAQCGNGSVDHSNWDVPPAVFTPPRPCYAIPLDKPATDLAGEMAASFAFGYLLFKDSNADYANILLTHAKSLYAYADNKRGKYSDSLPQAAGFYPSYGFMDELVWGAIALYIATNDVVYLNKAESVWAGSFANDTPWAQSYDNKVVSATLLLAKHTKTAANKPKYFALLNRFFTSFRAVPKVEGKLLVRDDWGSLRYASNFAAMAFYAYQNFSAAQITDRAGLYIVAKQQIDFILGDNNNKRSFVVGFGTNPPLKAHHKIASCPVPPLTCGYSYVDYAGANINTLSGALVGGPDKYGNYQDSRRDYQKNEVTTDYNAGYTLALAALLDITAGNVGGTDGGDTGSGNGTGNGNGTGTGNNTGDGNGNGSGSGNGSGNGTGNGTEDGSGSGNGNANGSGNNDGGSNSGNPGDNTDNTTIRDKYRKCGLSIKVYPACSSSDFGANCDVSCCKGTCPASLKIEDYYTQKICIEAKYNNWCDTYPYNYNCQRTCRSAAGNNSCYDNCKDKILIDDGSKDEQVCEDVYKNCKELKRTEDVCNNPGLKNNCKKTCCACTCPSAIKCEDYKDAATCIKIAFEGQCSNAYWGYQCQRSCKNCLTVDTCASNCKDTVKVNSGYDEELPCVDLSSDCAKQLKVWNICANSYYLTQCKKTCKVCK